MVIEKVLALDEYILLVLLGAFGQTGDFVLTRRMPSSNQAYAAEASHNATILFLPYCKFEIAFSG